MDREPDSIAHLRMCTNPLRTICEVIRELWEISEVLDETLRAEVQARLVDCYSMAKKMDRRLREYKYEWDADFWAVNEDAEADMRRRAKVRQAEE